MTRVPRATPVVLACLALLAGCGGHDAPAADPSTSTSASASSDPSEDATASSSASPATPSATPATGKRVDLETVSFNLPPGFKFQESAAGGSSWILIDELMAISTFEFPNISDEPLESLARSAVKQDKALTRQPDRVVDGQTGYVVSGTESIGFVYEFGLPSDDQVFSIEFSFATRDDQSMALIDSVLASMTFTS